MFPSSPVPDVQVSGVEEDCSVGGVGLLPVDVVEVDVIHVRILGTRTISSNHKNKTSQGACKNCILSLTFC